MFLRAIRPITFFLALGFSCLVGGQALAGEDSPDELNRRIGELSNRGKGKEAIPLAEKLVALTEQTRRAISPHLSSHWTSLLGVILL